MSCVINATFNESNQKLLARFKDMFFEKVLDDGETYTGAYEVTPDLETQTLETSDKYMIEDVVINSVPVAKVTNGAQGTTIIIG